MTLSQRLKRIVPRPFQWGSQTTTVLEFAGEWLKLAQVAVSAKGKKPVRLIARRATSQEELSKIILGLAGGGVIARESVVISIPRNLVTVRTLQLPTTDLDEIKEMVSLQAAKQTPYAKEEIIPDFRVVRTSPEGHTEVVLVTTHRSVSNAWLTILEDAGLKAEAIRLSSEGVLNSYRMSRGATAEEEKGPVAVVDVDTAFSDFVVIHDGETRFTRALSIGTAKLLEGREREIVKLAEEIQRAVDTYESERGGRKITRVLVAGAEIELHGLMAGLTEKLDLPIGRISAMDAVPGARELLDVSDGPRGTMSFAAVLGLAWDPGAAGIDLTPPEVRLKEALAHKGRAIVVTGVLGILVLSAVTALISQHTYFKKRYLERLNQEILRTQPQASEMEALKKKIRVIRDATSLENSSLEILSVLYERVPADTYLKGVTFEEGSQVTLKGVSQKMSTVFEFISALEKLPHFHQVKARNVARSGSKEGEEETEFEIVCPLTKGNEKT